MHLAIAWPRALLVGTLPGQHTSPKDRLLIAPAKVEDAASEVLASCNATTVW